jgi:hypothetical protein
MIKPKLEYDSTFSIAYDILLKHYELEEKLAANELNIGASCNCDNTNIESTLQELKDIIQNKECGCKETIIEKPVIVEKPVEVIKEVIVEKPVEKIVYKEKIVEKPVEVIKEIIKVVNCGCNHSAQTETHIIYPCPRPKPQEIKPTEYNVRKINGYGTKVIASDSAWERNQQRMAERNNTTDEYIHSSTCWNIMVKNPNYKRPVKKETTKKIVRRKIAI